MVMLVYQERKENTHFLLVTFSQCPNSDVLPRRSIKLIESFPYVIRWFFVQKPPLYFIFSFLGRFFLKLLLPRIFLLRR